MASYYLSPESMWSLDGAVSGTVDTDYQAAWLCDARVGRPAKATSGTVTWTITNSSGYVDAIVVANHNIDAGSTITIGGTVSASIISPTARPNSIPFNPWSTCTPSASCSTMSVAVSGNSASVVIGEVLAGRLLEFPGSGLLNADVSTGHQDLRRPSQSSFGSVPPYDPRQAARSFSGAVICTTAELDELWALYEAQQNGTRPSVLILDSSLQDAMVGQFDPPEASRDQTIWKVSLAFTEYPRSRW